MASISRSQVPLVLEWYRPMIFMTISDPLLASPRVVLPKVPLPPLRPPTYGASVKSCVPLVLSVPRLRTRPRSILSLLARVRSAGLLQALNNSPILTVVAVAVMLGRLATVPMQVPVFCYVSLCLMLVLAVKVAEGRSSDDPSVLLNVLNPALNVSTRLLSMGPILLVTLLGSLELLFDLFCSAIVLLRNRPRNLKLLLMRSGDKPKVPTASTLTRPKNERLRNPRLFKRKEPVSMT